jgi:hypothetical protein
VCTVELALAAPARDVPGPEALDGGSPSLGLTAHGVADGDAVRAVRRARRSSVTLAEVVGESRSALEVDRLLLKDADGLTVRGIAARC